MSDQIPMTIEQQTDFIWNAAQGKGVITTADILNADNIRAELQKYLRGETYSLPAHIDEVAKEYVGSTATDETTFIEMSESGHQTFWDKIKLFFVTMFTSVWGNFRIIMKQLFSDYHEQFNVLGSKYDYGEVSKSLKRFVEMGMIPQEAEQELKKLWGDFPLLKRLIPAIVPIMLSIIQVTNIMNTGGGDYAKKLLALFTPHEVPVDSLLRLAFLAPSETSTIRKKLKQSGYSTEDQNLMFAASLNMLDVQTIMTLFLRKEIDAPEVYKRMRQLGYTDDRTRDIQKVYQVIPPIQDVLTMVDREAFDPAIVSYYNYGEDSHLLPYDVFAAQGLSKEWVDRYWWAHWNIPSIQQGFEMLHRRVISDQELDDLFKTVEIPSWWREKLKAISYHPYTRVDVRRMHAMNVLSDQEVYEAYRDLGYDHEKALKMTEFTIKYNQDDDRELTRTQIETYYKSNLVSFDDAISMLTDIGYTEDRAHFFLTYQDYEKEKDYIDTVVDNAGDMYSLGLWDYNTTQTELYKLNLPAKQVSALFDTWNIKIYRDRKKPSKTDLDKFLKAQIITEDTYAEEMAGLGYNEKHVAMYIALATGATG